MEKYTQFKVNNEYYPASIDKSFVSFYEKLNELHLELASDYVGLHKHVKIKVKNSDKTFEVLPSTFNRSTYKTISNLIEQCKSNGDKINYLTSSSASKHIRVNIDTYDGVNIELSVLGYSKFVQGRKNTYNMYKEYGYSIVTGYKGTQLKQQLRCNNGHITNTTPGLFRRGVRCAKCSNQCAEQAKEDLYSLANKENYTITGNYINTVTKIDMICPNNHKISIRPNDFKQNKRCPYCRVKRSEQNASKQNIEEIKLHLFKSKAEGSNLIVAKNSFINFCKKLNDVNLELVSDYVSISEKVKVKNKFNDITFDISPDGFNRYTYKSIISLIEQCNANGDKLNYLNTSPKSKKVVANIDTFDGASIELTISRYSKFVEGRKNTYKMYEQGGYTAITGYKGVRLKQQLKCNNGHITNTTPNHFKKGVRCAKCSNQCAEQAKEDLYSLAKKENYTITGNYINTMTKIDMICPNNHKISIRPNDFKQNKRCPHCRQSKGERRISEYFVRNNIEFVREKTFEGLKDKNYLRYDFYIPSLNLLIEYDGIQHFLPRFFDGSNKKVSLERLKDTQKKDRLKNEFAKNKAYLLRIPYWSIDNLEKILDRFILELSEDIALSDGIKPKTYFQLIS